MSVALYLGVAPPRRKQAVPQRSTLTDRAAGQTSGGMYPFVRMAYHMNRARRQPPLTLDEPHISSHICWPWDLDFAMELNNGRTLSLLDLGRLPLFLRAGMFPLVRKHRWQIAMAGVIVRYRRRVRAFDRFEMQTKILGWDKRFIYIEQTMWKRDGECANHAVYRVAVTDKNGILDPAVIAELRGIPAQSPDLPAWIEAWSSAEALRPWPPERAPKA